MPKINDVGPGVWKVWVTNISDVGPCEFCDELNDEVVRIGQNWTHPRIKDKSGNLYTNIKPGHVHDNVKEGSCRCTYRIEIKNNY